MIYYFVLLVSSLPVGLAMFKKYKRTKSTTVPFEIQRGDTPKVVKVKSLAFKMISYKPEERPTAEEVLHEIQLITGNQHVL